MAQHHRSTSLLISTTALLKELFRDDADSYADGASPQSRAGLKSHVAKVVLAGCGDAKADPQAQLISAAMTVFHAPNIRAISAAEMEKLAASSPPSITIASPKKTTDGHDSRSSSSGDDDDRSGSDQNTDDAHRAIGDAAPLLLPLDDTAVSSRDAFAALLQRGLPRLDCSQMLAASPQQAAALSACMSWLRDDIAAIATSG